MSKDFFNPEVKNSASVQEIIKYYKALNPHQAKYILELLKDLNKCVRL